MKNYVITFTYDEILKNFLCAYLKECGCESFEVNASGKNAVISFCSEEDVFIKTVCESFVYKKFVIMKERLKKKEEISPILYSAYLGVIVGEEEDEEGENVRKLIPQGNAVNIDGMIRFLLSDTEKTWKALGELAARLLSSCAEDEDVLALIKYFLSGASTIKRTVIVDETLRFADNGEALAMLEPFGSFEENALFNLLWRRPTEIFIPVPTNYSEKFIGVIKKLGV